VLQYEIVMRVPVEHVMDDFIAVPRGVELWPVDTITVAGVLQVHAVPALGGTNTVLLAVCLAHCVPTPEHDSCTVGAWVPRLERQ